MLLREQYAAIVIGALQRNYRFVDDEISRLIELGQQLGGVSEKDVEAISLANDQVRNAVSHIYKAGNWLGENNGEKMVENIILARWHLDRASVHIQVSSLDAYRTILDICLGALTKENRPDEKTRTEILELYEAHEAIYLDVDKVNMGRNIPKKPSLPDKDNIRDVINLVGALSVLLERFQDILENLKTLNPTLLSAKAIGEIREKRNQKKRRKAFWLMISITLILYADAFYYVFWIESISKAIIAFVSAFIVHCLYVYFLKKLDT